MAKTSGDNNFEVAATLGSLSAQVEKLEEEMKATREDVRVIRDTLNGAAGSWKMLLAVASIISTVLLTLGWNIFELFYPKK